MHLLDYIEKNFPVNGSWTNEDLIDRFMQVFGVNAKFEDGPAGTYWIFKYGMIEAKWYPVTKECRGAILHRGDKWKVMSRPFDKFFNQHEGHCPVFEKGIFEDRINDFFFVEKLDGSCIQLWWDEFNRRWRASTLGMITTTTISDFSEETFESMFWKVLGLKLEDEYSMSTQHTYIFELCTEENRIVTQYEDDCIYYLGSRDNIDGRSFNSANLYVPEALRGKVKVPHQEHLCSQGILTLQGCKDWVEKEASSGKYGKYPEGFVIYDQHGPLCKMKNSAYLVLYHAAGAGNLAHSVNCAIDSFWKGTIDDVWEVLPDSVKEKIDILREWYRDKIVGIMHNISELREQEFKPGREGQKDYALAVQKFADKRMQAFFFQNREAVEDKTVSANELFSDWMRINAGKWTDYWKEIMVSNAKEEAKKD